MKKLRSIFFKSLAFLALLIYGVVAMFVFSLLMSRLLNCPLYITPEVSSIFSEFRLDAEKYQARVRFRNMVIVLSDTMPITGTLAYCTPYYNFIAIDRATWKELTYLKRKLLVYHELGHCALLRNHFGAMLPPCPYSIMYPHIDPSIRCFVPAMDYYIEELFTNPYKLKLLSGGM